MATTCGHDEPVHAKGLCRRCYARNRARAYRTDPAYLEKERLKMAAFRAEHPDRATAIRDAWYAANREKVLAKSAAYRKANLAKMKALIAAWGDANPERLRASAAKYRASHPDRVAAATMRWRRANKEKYAEGQRKWARIHPEIRAGYNKKYRLLWTPAKRDSVRAVKRRLKKLHPESNRAYAHRRRAREAAVPNTLTRKEWAEVRAYFGGRCAYCLARVRLTLDHIEPIARGGHHVNDNVVPACGSCNSSKNDRPILIWLWRKAS